MNDLGGVFDQLPVDRFLPNDLGVVLPVGGMRNAAGDFGQHFVTADLLELTAFFQLFRQRDGIDPLAIFIHVADRREDHLVGVTVKVLGPDDRNHVMEDLVIPQDAAEQALLGFQVLGRQAVGKRPHVRFRTAAEAVLLAVPWTRVSHWHHQLPTTSQVKTTWRSYRHILLESRATQRSSVRIPIARFSVCTLVSTAWSRAINVNPGIASRMERQPGTFRPDPIRRGRKHTEATKDWRGREPLVAKGSGQRSPGAGIRRARLRQHRQLLGES